MPLDAAERLRLAAYTPEEVRWLSRAPITYPEGGAQAVEYPDGRRLEVQRVKEYAEDGTFVRYRFRCCTSAPRPHADGRAHPDPDRGANGSGKSTFVRALALPSIDPDRIAASYGEGFTPAAPLAASSIFFAFRV